MSELSNNVWDGFNRWAKLVNDQERIAQVWNNQLSVRFSTSNEFLGRVNVSLSKRGMVWEDTGDFTWGDDFVFVNQLDGTLYPMSSQEVYNEISLISKKLADIVELILS